MIDYPYVPDRPLEKVVRYDYSSSEDDAFFEAWYHSRSDFESRLRDVSARPLEQLGLLQPADLLSCYSIINECPACRASDSFWSLVRKFEVFGRLFDGYTYEILRHPAAKPAGIGVYIRFVSKLHSLTARTGVLQFLSTGLKVVDALSGLAIEKFDRKTAGETIVLIARERELVSNIIGYE